MGSSTGNATYAWYRHHGWGGMAAMSVFLLIERFYLEIPPLVTGIVVCVLLTYVLWALVQAYRHSPELKQKQPVAKPTLADPTGSSDAKAAKKVAKAESKAAKKAAKALSKQESGDDA